MPRFVSLTLILSLFALPALVHAQTAAPSKDTVLFDFESDNFDDWTLSGDCWDKQPATSKTFVDKSGRSSVSGIGGNGCLTTLYKNTATTGKTVSKEFTIDKPFLTFKGGGSV